MNIIEVDNLCFKYPQADVLRKVSFAVRQGIFLAIIGPNGVGKSTLLNLLSGSLKPARGDIKIDGKKIESYSTEKLAEKIAVVRQEFIPVFGFSVIETVLMARTTHFGRLGFENKLDRLIVNEALNVTDTARFANRLLANLSAGERQRVFIARALAQDTPVLLLDEPTNFLDLKHQVGIYDLLKSAQLEKGKTIIAVTHDINLTAQYCDEVLFLEGISSYRHGSPEEVLTAEQITKVFGVDVFSGRLVREKFFIPMGKFAKDKNIT
jgi:iron complex transport system ATP-binding protein